MVNGIDPAKGQILVPLDLGREIIEPLRRLEDGLDDLSGKFGSHLTAHEVEVAVRKKRRDQMWRATQWTGGAILTILTALAGARAL